jgi:hypothetical protein
MAESRKYTVGGITFDVVEVKIVNRLVEEVNEYELEDGSVIRVSNPSMVVYRVDSAKDQEGIPGYFVKNGTSLVVVKGPKKEMPN